MDGLVTYESDTLKVKQRSSHCMIPALVETSLTFTSLFTVMLKKCYGGVVVGGKRAGASLEGSGTVMAQLPLPPHLHLLHTHTPSTPLIDTDHYTSCCVLLVVRRCCEWSQSCLVMRQEFKMCA